MFLTLSDLLNCFCLHNPQQYLLFGQSTLPDRDVMCDFPEPSNNILQLLERPERDVLSCMIRELPPSLRVVSSSKKCSGLYPLSTISSLRNVCFISVDELRLSYIVWCDIIIGDVLVIVYIEYTINNR